MTVHQDTDPEGVSRPFNDALYDEKAQLHKSIAKIQKLEREQMQQIREMERQKQQVQQEIQRLLNDFLATSKDTNLQQRQLLQNVVGDPTTLGILQEVLIQAQTLHHPTPGEVSSTPNTPISPHVYRNAPQLFSTTPPTLTTPTAMTTHPLTVNTDVTHEVKVEKPVFLVGESSESALLSMLTTPPQGEPSPQSSQSTFDSPTLSLKNRSLKDLTPGEQEKYKEFRRRSHISAEQKRRGNIKSGFDRLQAFVTNLSGPSNTKLSKASVLLKSIEYTQYMQRERANQEKEIESLKKRIEELNAAIKCVAIHFLCCCAGSVCCYANQ
jgi:MAX-like protein X